MVGIESHLNGPLNPTRSPRLRVGANGKPSVVSRLLDSVKVGDRVRIGQAGITLRHNGSSYCDSQSPVRSRSWR